MALLYSDPWFRPSLSVKEQRRIEAGERQQRARVRRQQQVVASRIEKEIANGEGREAEILTALQDPATYTQTALAADLNHELKELDARLQDLHQAWETEATRLEGLAG